MMWLLSQPNFSILTATKTEQSISLILNSETWNLNAEKLFLKSI